MSLSIRWRLAIGIVAAFLVTLAVIFVTVQLSLRAILTSDQDRSLAENADRVQAEVALAGGLDDSARLLDIVRRYSISREGQSAFITVIRDPEGAVVAATPGVTTGRMVLSAAQLEDVLGGGTAKQDVELPGGREFRVRSEALRVAGEVVGVVQVAESTETTAGPVDRLLIILIAEGIGATVLALAVAWWLSRGAVKPLEQVIDVATEIEAEDLSRRIGARRQPAEVQRLADTFDAMLDRLDQAFSEQKDFVTDVSHELRTPLTALRGNIDVMLMDQRLDVETRDALERMSSEVERLIRLTNNLLYIASADAGREPERRPVELDVVCLEVLRHGRHLRPDVKLSMAHEDQVVVLGDRDQLKQMVLSLVENGVKYSQTGGQVTMGLYKNGTTARITVDDTGPGIAPEALSRIFERFYRGEDRSRKSGTGLGLAIANRIAVAHGGSISVESEVGRGSSFTVTLPLVPPAADKGESAGDDPSG